MVIEIAGCPARLGCLRAPVISRMRHPIPTMSRSVSVIRSYATGARHGASQSRVCPFATVSARPGVPGVTAVISTGCPQTVHVIPAAFRPPVAAPSRPVSPRPAALASVSALQWRLPLHSFPNSVPYGPERSVRNGRSGRMTQAMGSAPARPRWRGITRGAPESAGSAHTMRERVAVRWSSGGSRQGQERGGSAASWCEYDANSAGTSARTRSARSMACDAPGAPLDARYRNVRGKRIDHHMTREAAR